MFRDGGRANSKGTGIMSGIEEREGFQKGQLVGGGQMSRNQTLSGQPFNLLDYLRGLRPENFTASGQMSRTQEPGGEGVDLTPSIIPEANAEELYGDLNIELKKKPPIPKIKETTSTVTDLAKGMEEGAKKTFKGLEDDEDLDDIKLDDFEEEITKKAELYEKLLGGKDARAQAGFRALTAGGLEALEEGSVVSGLKKGSEELAGADDLSRKAKLLAIQEKIAKDAQKTPTKAQEVDILAKRYMDNGMNRADAYAAAEKKVYGTEKSQLLSAYSPDRELQDLTAAFAKSDDDLISQNPSGFAQAELYKRQGVKTISYESYYDSEKERSDYRPTITPGDISPGDVFFDPVSFQFFYKNKAGETGSSYSLEEAKTKASG